MRVIGTVAALLLAAYGNVVVAPAAMPEFAASKWIAWVTGACAFGWLVQFRYRNARLDVRVRTATHLVYYFFMVYLHKLINLAVGLVLADLLFQSILQADPVIPLLADALGRGELARGILEGTLSVEERFYFQWVYVGISVTLIVAMTPLRIMIGGGEYSWIMSGTGAGWYRIWILQRINQDLRTALIERWHTLSLSYHSDHRTGDSIFRIYQDSAQVTSVIDSLLGISMLIFSYATAIFLLSLLSPWIGLIMLSVVVPTLAWAKWAMPRMRTKALAARAATSDVTSRLQESFSAIRLIKAYGAEDRIQRRLEDDSVILFNTAYRVRVLMALVGIITFSIVAGAMLASEYLVARWAYLGVPTFSVELIAFVGLSFVIWNLTAHQWSQNQFQSAAAGIRWGMQKWMAAQDIAMGLKRVFDILDLEPDVVDAEDAVPSDPVPAGSAVRQRELRLRAGPPGARRCQFRRRKRHHHRHRGSHGLRQEHADGAPAAPLRSRGRGGVHRRHRPARLHGGFGARQHRHRLAGKRPVRDVGARQHPLRRPGCGRGPGQGSHPDRLHGGLRGRVAGRSGHRPRRPRRPHLDGPAPATVHRPRRGAQHALADPRRTHGGA